MGRRCSKFFLLLFLLEIFASCKTYGQSPSPPYGSSNTSFSSSTAVVMVVLVSVFFLLGFFSVYIRQCTDRRMSLTGGIDGNFIGSIGRRRGLDEAVINSFPTFEYSSVKWLKIGKGALECAVCLTEFEDDETLRLIPRCNHVFHPNCIDVWLSSHSTCPVCRANLVPKPEEMPFQTPDFFNSNAEPRQTDEPDRRSNAADAAEEIVHDQLSVHAPRTPKSDLARSPAANSISPLQKISPIQTPVLWSLPGFLPRSHSTGHSLVQVGNNWERFTLRLPEEVRNEIVKSSLHRSKSWGILPTGRSPRKGYRNGDGDGSSRGGKYYDREVKPDRWGFSMTPPFILRTGTVRSPKMAISGSEEGSYNNNKPRTLIQSVKSPIDRLILGIDTKSNSSNQCNDGERSFDRLRSDHVV